MSELPDDVRRWPKDPFQLLGVPRDVPPRELKRAYTRLILAYKPEHAPEEFRRIREAYDAVRRFVEMFGAFHEEAAAQPFESEEPAESETPRFGPPADSPPRSPAAPVTSLEEKLDECWEWAIAEDEPRAYQTLLQIQAQIPHDARIGARLYWLLSLAPEIDRDRSPCDWLVAGLKRTGFSGPLRELYRRELAANRIEALGDRCVDLIDALPASPGLAELVEWRWNAVAGADRTTELIRDDLAKLRDRFLAHDEEAWARLVFAAADRVAFIDSDDARELMSRYESDLKALEHLHLRLAQEFDRFELLQQLAATTRALSRGGAPWHADFVDVVRRGWITPMEELRPRLMAYLAAIAARPGQMLHRLDAVWKTAPPLLHQFRGLLARLDSITEPADDRRSEADVAELVMAFACETPAARYADWRPPLLDFCLREVLMPEQVAAALADHAEFQLSAEVHLSQAALADLPLVCVCHACRLFWA
ncbi:MAG TPA: J domain-containing protein [Pirellulales bacterium]